MPAQVIQFPAETSTLYDVRTVRRVAESAGFDPAIAVYGFARSGYSRTYLAELSERARQARMAAQQLPGGAA